MSFMLPSHAWLFWLEYVCNFDGLNWISTVDPVELVSLAKSCRRQIPSWMCLTETKNIELLSKITISSYQCIFQKHTHTHLWAKHVGFYSQPPPAIFLLAAMQRLRRVDSFEQVQLAGLFRGISIAQAAMSIVSSDPCFESVCCVWRPIWNV